MSVNMNERLKYRDTHPARQWFDRHYGPASRLKKAMKAYPAYRPPHPAPSTLLTEQQALANYEYFQNNKAVRMRRVLDLLETFNVRVNPTAPERCDLLALDAWAYQQWPGIYEESLTHSVTQGFDQTGFTLTIRSLLFDISVLLGECYLSLNTEACWFLDTSSTSAREVRSSWNRIVIWLPPIPGQEAGWHSVLDMEEHVRYHYRMQRQSLDTIRVQQRIGKILSEPVLATLK